MLEKIPTAAEMTALTGPVMYGIWEKLCAAVDAEYEMERIWNSGGKAWTYEYKYRRGGKTLCTLYAKENRIGFMVILGKSERETFEAERESFSEAVQRAYDGAATYHDGKWIMFEPSDTSWFGDFMRLLHIKRKPNKRGQ